MNRGSLRSVIADAQGPVNVASTWGNGTDVIGEGVIRFSGSATRSINLPVLPNRYNPVELNAPNTTVNLIGAGEVKLTDLRLFDGSLRAGTSSLRLHTGGGRRSEQSGGVLNCGSGVVTFDGGRFTQTGGSFDCQSATINGTSSANLILNGGTFNAPTGTMTWTGGVFERGEGGTFDHKNGTLIFGGTSVEMHIVNDNLPTRQEFGNLTVVTTEGLYGGGGDPLSSRGIWSWLVH